jgi:hypothetical protein
MQQQFVEILGIYPGMYASKFQVRIDSWEHFCETYMNSPDHGNCFVPCKDAEGDTLFVDMTKLLAFYVLTKEPKKKIKNGRKKATA